MKKALAKNIKTKQLLEILKNFSEDEYVDIEVFEFSGESPDKIIIRVSRTSSDIKSTEKDNRSSDEYDKDEKSSIKNPGLSENISYKDLLDSLN